MYTNEEYNRLLGPRDNDDGTAFVAQLYERTIWQGDERSENWPIGISRLFRLYKKAQRDFLRCLYIAAWDIIPKEDLFALAWPVASRESEGWGVQVPRRYLHHPYIILTDAVALRSLESRVHPEMMLALQAAISARQIVDAYCKEERDSLPYNSEAYARSAGHERWIAMLVERMEILRPEYEKWYSNAAASLAGVSRAIERIGTQDDHESR